MKATAEELARITRLLQRKQSTINRLRDELKAAKALNQEVGAALNAANARAALWRTERMAPADTRMDPLDVEIPQASLWQRIRAWLGRDMADDGKRTEVICTKATERVALDLLRAAALEDITPSEYMYRLLREHFYGRMVRVNLRTGVNEVNAASNGD